MKRYIAILSVSTLLFSGCSTEMPIDPSYDTLGNNMEYLDELYMSKLPRDTISVLAIGNSFAQDALYDFFFDICKNLNTDVAVGVLHIPSASLDMHLHNAITDSAAYDFRVQNIDGSLYINPHCPISKAMKHTNWDYVTLQQVSIHSGIYETYNQSLPDLFDFVKSHTKDEVKIGWHQTWAYDKEHIPIEYNNEQEYMYECIMQASLQVMKDYDFDFIVPCGTAIQNARTSIIGDNLNRDGNHLNLMGKYIAACVWVESIIHRSVVGNKIIADNSKETTRIAQIAAHNAAARPFEVTETDYVYELRP